MLKAVFVSVVLNALFFFNNIMSTLETYAYVSTMYFQTVIRFPRFNRDHNKTVENLSYQVNYSL